MLIALERWPLGIEPSYINVNIDRSEESILFVRGHAT